MDPLRSDNTEADETSIGWYLLLKIEIWYIVTVVDAVKSTESGVVLTEDQTQREQHGGRVRKFWAESERSIVI